MAPWVALLAGWAYFVLVVVMVLLALFRRRDGAAALGWSLAIVFLPGIGILLFALFGVTRIPRRLRRKVAHHQAFSGRLVAPEGEAGEEARETASRWAPVTRLLQGIDGTPRRRGNAVVLYDGGSRAFDAMEEAIRAARHHVHVEFYIFRNDDLGRHATDVLVEKCRAGVEVRVLVDAVGSLGNRRLVKRIRRAGGEAARFLPLRPFGKRLTANLRNHRKLVVCDGRVAFFGGLNVGVEYLGRAARRAQWYDLHARVRGPAVWDLQRMFAEDWDFTTGRFLDGDAYFPALDAAGQVPVQIVSGGPDQPVNAVRAAWFAGLVNAKERIRLLTPYLVPDRSLRDALTTAARSGVDVRILTPRPPGDSRLVHLCSLYYAEELLEAGVRLFSYRPGMMHAKAVVVDGDWGMLGTANLDNRSLGLNFEQMAVFDGRPHVERLEAALEGALADGRELTLEDLHARPLTARALSAGARLLAPLL